MKNTHPLLISLAAAIAVTCTAVAETSFNGTVKANDHINIPEKQTVMYASVVRQVYSAKYLLIVK